MGLKNEARKCNRNIKYYRDNYWLTDYKFKPWTRDCLTRIVPFWHETDSFGGLTPYNLASHNTHALINMIARDLQTHNRNPETVHQVCHLHKQWHQDYEQLKVWYKNNDDNIGGVLNEDLALCIFSNSELFHWTKTCNKRFWWKWLVVRGDHYLKMQLVTWLLSFRWLLADTVTIFRCKHWSYRAKRNLLTEVPSEFAEMYQVAAC